MKEIIVTIDQHLMQSLIDVKGLSNPLLQLLSQVTGVVHQ